MPLLLACAVEAPAARSTGISDKIASEPMVDTIAFFEAFDVVSSLTLEETDAVVTVAPRITADRTGELLVADPQEGQVRIYDRDGSLKAVLGRRGGGPGEFQRPMSARRTTDRRIVVADPMLSRVTFLSGTADSLTTVTSPVRMLVDVQDLGDGRFLFAGPGAGDGPAHRFLHIWDAETGRVERSFLPMGVPEQDRDVAASFAGVSVVLEADTIWAVWALSDTLYKFNSGGELLGLLPLPLARQMGPLPTIDDLVAGYAEMGAALGSITQVGDVFITEGGDFVIQSVQSRGLTFECDLVIMDRFGQPQLQLIGSPRLFLVDGDLYYFDDPATLLPNRLLVVRRRVADR
ncbi:MAG: 6-bladed beta-propeller [Gammaproteobacteria bacterium]|nr:6-bladed beta-propeller [Gammaproteobacteria bacterium]MYA43151.1 hypothetical protein [Gemmatimonadota bacterium]